MGKQKHTGLIIEISINWKWSSVQLLRRTLKSLVILIPIGYIFGFDKGDKFTNIIGLQKNTTIEIVWGIRENQQGRQKIGNFDSTTVVVIYFSFSYVFTHLYKEISIDIDTEVPGHAYKYLLGQNPYYFHQHNYRQFVFADISKKIAEFSTYRMIILWLMERALPINASRFGSCLLILRILS